MHLSIFQVSTNPKTLINNCTASLEVPLLKKVMNGDRILKRERERERKREILDIRY
jgi:hypothetical protein